LPSGNTLFAGGGHRGSELAEYTPGGAVNTAFGSSGFVSLPTFTILSDFQDNGNYYWYSTPVVAMPNGNLLMAGASENNQDEYSIAVEELNPNGSTDTSFGSNGILALSPPNVWQFPAMAVSALPDGSFLVENSGYGYPTLAKYSSNGAPVTSFGTDGIVNLHSGYWMNAISILQSGNILLSGGATSGSGVLMEYR